MPWQTTIFPLLIIVSGSGFTGIFSYSPSPGSGNLIGSAGVAAGGTDPFGNAYLAGDTSYRQAGPGLFEAAQNFGGVLTFYTATSAAGPWTAVGVLTPAGATGTTMSLQALAGHLLQLVGGQVTVGAAAPSTTEQLEVQGNIAVTLVKAVVSGVEETWHVIAPGSFLNSFTAGGTAPRFQLEPVGGGRVRLSGAVNTGAVTAASTAMFNLPAGYRPSRAFNFVTPNNVTAYTLGQASVAVATTGDVQLVPAGTAGKFVTLDGICFELD